MKYMTEQRKLLLSFLSDHRDQQYSVEEITAALQEKADISASSIYRNINELVREGSVARFKEGSRRCVYQYIGTTECAKHLHLKCEQCGNLFHLEDEAMEHLMDNIKTTNNFSIDIKKSILFGCCENCEQAE